jgi:2-amino-4-hydroxy-6-hydroxymethyldihydropteridine diphosphokinase
MCLAYIALGANIPSVAGSPKDTLMAAIARLRTLGTVVVHSRLYVTEPVGYADQPRFVNAALALRTELGPEALLAHLLEIEAAFGRDRARGIPNGPRTLDLDLLLHGDLVLQTGTLQLPHPRMAERLFVLEPLAEIAPELIHPIHRKSMSQLLKEKNETVEEVLNGERLRIPLAPTAK